MTRKNTIVEHNGYEYRSFYVSGYKSHLWAYRKKGERKSDKSAARFSIEQAQQEVAFLNMVKPITDYLDNGGDTQSKKMMDLAAQMFGELAHQLKESK